MRVQPQDQALCGAQVVVVRPGELPEPGVVALREGFEVMLHNGRRKFCDARIRVRLGHQRPDLQEQAFARGACADAGGLHVLQVPERDAEVLHIRVRLGRQEQGDFLERLGEVAVIVHGVNQHPDQCPVALWKVCQRQLVVEVLPE